MNELRLDHIKSSKESINELDSKSSTKDTKQSSCETETDLSKIEIRKLQKQLKENNENFEEKKKKEVNEIKNFYEGKIKIIKEEIKNDREAKIKEYLANTEEIYDIVEETKKLQK